MIVIYFIDIELSVNNLENLIVWQLSIGATLSFNAKMDLADC